MDVGTPPFRRCSLELGLALEVLDTDDHLTEYRRYP